MGILCVKEGGSGYLFRFRVGGEVTGDAIYCLSFAKLHNFRLGYTPITVVLFPGEYDSTGIECVV